MLGGGGQRAALVRRRLEQSRPEWGWASVAVGAMVVIGLVDLVLPSNANIAGALVLVPFLASGGVHPRGVTLTGFACVAEASGLAVADGSGLRVSLARIIVIALGTLVAAQAAAVRLRREQRLLDLTHVAETAQRAIIREPPPRVGDVAIATYYQSSVRAATVGGDCFEALDTPFGTRIMIGDVRGHGLPSVRLAALVLGGFRALAYMEPDLAVVARELDLLATRYGQDPDGEPGSGEEFVTAVFAQVAGSVVTLGNCGHPPPLLVHGDHVRLLAASAPARPLGMGLGDEPPPLDAVTVPAGGRVLLYTDGLIEARDAAGRFFDLSEAAGVLGAGPLDAGVAALVGRLNAHAPGRVLDDVALVALEPLAPLPR